MRQVLTILDIWEAAAGGLLSMGAQDCLAQHSKIPGPKIKQPHPSIEPIDSIV